MDLRRGTLPGALIAILLAASIGRAAEPAWLPGISPLPDMKRLAAEIELRRKFTDDAELALNKASNAYPLPKGARDMLLNYLRLAPNPPENRDWIGVINLGIREKGRPNVFWINVARAARGLPEAVRTMRVPPLTAYSGRGDRLADFSNTASTFKYSLGIVEAGPVFKPWRDYGTLGLVMAQNGVTPGWNNNMRGRGMWWHFWSVPDYTIGCFTSTNRADLEFVFNHIAGQDPNGTPVHLGPNGKISGSNADPIVRIAAPESAARGAVYVVWSPVLEPKP